MFDFLALILVAEQARVVATQLLQVRLRVFRQPQQRLLLRLERLQLLLQQPDSASHTASNSRVVRRAVFLYSTEDQSFTAANLKRLHFSEELFVQRFVFKQLLTQLLRLVVSGLCCQQALL